ncbi:MAG: DUF11 domain-containing protein, partial [Verrucomicrobiota bacterium]
VWGGGVFVADGSVIHCTISSNKAVDGFSDTGSSGLHATSGSTVDNCIMYFNGSVSNDTQSSRNYQGVGGSTISSSCALPLQPGPGNIDSDPQFFDLAATNFRLTAMSPCVDTASPTSSLPVDLHGTARPIDGDGNGSFLPDMGAIEFSSNAYDIAIRKIGPAQSATNVVMNYTLLLTNYGPGMAAHLVITDSLPAGVAYLSSSPQCVYTNHEVICTLSNFAAGASTSLTISVRSPLVPSVIENQARVNRTPNDPFDFKDTASWITDVNFYDISVVNTGPVWVESNTFFAYTLVVSNTGPGTAANVILTDILPPSAGFQAGPAGCVHNSGVVTCTLDDLVGGSSTTLQLFVTSSAGYDVLTNRVDVTSGGDTNRHNNAGSWVTDVAVYDVAIRKSSPPQVLTNKSFAYTISVSNAGPGIARNLIVSDPLPTQVMFQSASPACVFSNGQVICTLPDLPPGAGTSLNIHVVAPPYTSIFTNHVALNSGSGDTNPLNNLHSMVTHGILATTRYVNVSNTNPAPPYLT